MVISLIRSVERGQFFLYIRGEIDGESWGREEHLVRGQDFFDFLALKKPTVGNKLVEGTEMIRYNRAAITRKVYETDVISNTGR